LAPSSTQVAFLAGRLDISRGRLDEGVAGLRRAVDLDPGNLKARFALAQEIEQACGPDADVQAEKQFDALLAARPEKVAALIDRFLQLPPPLAAPSPADTGLTFSGQPIGANGPSTAASVVVFSLGADKKEAVFGLSDRDLRRLDVDAPPLSLPAGASGAASNV